MKETHKKNIIEAGINCLVAAIVTGIVVTCISINIPFEEFATLFITDEICCLAAYPVICKLEDKRYKNEQKRVFELSEEFRVLTNQLSKDKIKLSALSKNTIDDSKLNSKKIDINDQNEYLNNLQNKIDNNKTKVKSRFKK